jgi:hypothetical protein
MNVDLFLHLVFSPSSEKIDYVRMHTVLGWVVLHLWGPITDDIYYEPEVKGDLPEFETHMLHTEFKLWRVSLPNYLPLKEDRDKFVDRLYELGLGNPEHGIRHTCNTLELRRK